MVNPISSNNVAASGLSSASRARPEASADLGMTAAKADAATADTVELSNGARAKLLRQQGLSIAEIATKLGLDVKTVSSYFPSVSAKAAE